MHNFNERPECQYVKKYRASVSLNGDTVDVLDAQDNVKGSFTIKVKHGKAVLEEMVNHSTIVIPTHGEVESVSTFTYDSDNNTVSATIFDIHGHAQEFIAKVEDLMGICNKLFEPVAPKHDHLFPKRPHEDVLDPKFSYDEHKPHHPHDRDECKFKPEHEYKPNKPLIDPYVTKSELLDESRKRQYNDTKILEIIGNNSKDNKSIFGHIDALTSTMSREIERSKHTDKIHDERLDKVEKDLDVLHTESNFKDSELRKFVKKESDAREKGDTELFKQLNLAQNDILKTNDKIEFANAEIRKEQQRARSTERDLHNEVMREEGERIIGDKKLTSQILKEETARINDFRDLNSKIEAEYGRAKCAEALLSEDITKAFGDLKRDNNFVLDKVNDAVDYAMKSFQEKGDYVSYSVDDRSEKCIVLNNGNGYNVKDNRGYVHNIGIIGLDNKVIIGSQELPLLLQGDLSVRPMYNTSEMALAQDVDSAKESLKQEMQVEATKIRTQINEYVGGFQKQLDTLKEAIEALKKEVQELKNA